MNAVIRLLAALLLVLGLTFFIWGMNASETFANRFMKEMAGEYPSETKWYIFGGITMIVVGIGMLIANFFRKKR